MEKEKNLNWIPVIELAVLAFTTLGTTIVLFTHAENNNRKSEERTNAILECIRQDIKDFHGRLCAIEERNKGK